MHFVNIWLYGKGKFFISSGRIAEVKLIIVSATAMMYNFYMFDKYGTLLYYCK